MRLLFYVENSFCVAFTLRAGAGVKFTVLKFTRSPEVIPLPEVVENALKSETLEMLVLGTLEIGTHEIV